MIVMSNGAEDDYVPAEAMFLVTSWSRLLMHTFRFWV